MGIKLQMEFDMKVAPNPNPNPNPNPMKVAQAKAEAEAEMAKAEARKKAIEMEAEALSKLDENGLKVRMWEAQLGMVQAMYANQRTFVDTSSMPTMAQMLNMQALGGMGLFPIGQPQTEQGKQ